MTDFTLTFDDVTVTFTQDDLTAMNAHLDTLPVNVAWQTLKAVPRELRDALWLNTLDTADLDT